MRAPEPKFLSTNAITIYSRMTAITRIYLSVWLHERRNLRVRFTFRMSREAVKKRLILPVRFVLVLYSSAYANYKT